MSQTRPDPARRRCLNCGTPLPARYCPQCAQDSTLERVSLVALLRRGLDALQDLDGAFLRTIAGMTRRPGAVAAEYVEGARRRYTNPVKYALIFGALLAVSYRVDPLGRARLLPEVPPDSPPAVTIMYELMPFFVEYAQVMMLLSAPLLALFLWAFFPRTKRNFAEQCAMILFVYGHIYLLQLPFVLAGAFGSVEMSLALAILQTFWLSWTAVRFYGGRPWLTFLRATIPHAFFLIAFNIGITIFIVARHGSDVLAPPS